MDQDNTVTFTWKDAHGVLPDDMNKALVCQTQSGKIITFNSCGTERMWKFHVDKYHVKYWAYQSELIAK